MSEDGPHPEYPPVSERASKDAVVKMIKSGQYTIEYDGNGLQTNTGAAKVSTWYAFEVKTKADKIVGEYHIHPKSGGGFASGNFRLFYNQSHPAVAIGHAWEWNWLCARVKSKVP